MKAKKIFILRLMLAILVLCSTASAQEKVTLEIGKPFPDITFGKVSYFPSTQFRVLGQKGKIVVLDFWGINCSSCIESFPHVSDLQKKYAGKVQFMHVAMSENPVDQQKMRTLYGKYHDRLKLATPCSFDFQTFKSFKINGAPYLIIIDGNGTVKGISAGIREQNIIDLLAGRETEFPKLSSEKEDKQDIATVLSGGSTANEDETLLGSSLRVWKRNQPQAVKISIDVDKDKGVFQTTGAIAEWLYFYAYFGQPSIGMGDGDELYGKIYPVPALEIKDSTVFNFDFEKPKNVYNYTVKMPANQSSKEAFQRIMREDLKAAFGFNVRLEKRKRPYWRLVATDQARIKLLAKGDSTYSKGSWDGIFFRNQDLLDIRRGLSSNLGLKEPLLDETGISGKIDLDLDVLIKDKPALIKALQANGLDIVKGEKEMEVLVISDPKPVSR